ncbi:hypothetical protein G3I59_47235 [Amycolatopsis rubida]|uniref:Uncharacterized protein n=1 Tax=Amycolatopsis rubida TaxID=112413 RepID=A0ABX0C5F6_9PSEU|nr:MULTISPECIES: hypothetical protein [Amycolatopsis]MYW98004.1 hypothetical protein [Amycolatopsis rubida]NEC62989.1 hypothetical protein [Amycolatopsis rubida]
MQKQRFQELLQWPDYIITCFGHDNATHWERALLWATAALDGASKVVIIAAAQALLKYLKIATSPAQAFVAVDLSRALKTIDAENTEDRVSITTRRPGAGQAVLNHVYREFPDLREVLLDWLASLPSVPGVGPAYADLVSRRLQALAIEADAAEVLEKAERMLGTDSKNHSLTVSLLTAAALDERLRTPARELNCGPGLAGLSQHNNAS